MAKPASMSGFRRLRKAAIKACADAVGVLSVSSKEHQAEVDKALDQMLKVVRVWMEKAPKNILTNPDAFNEIVQDDFAEIKTRTKEAAKAEYNRLLKLHEENKNKEGYLGRAPKGTEALAAKNSSKGVRQRRSPLEDLQELVELDLEAAKDSVRVRADNEPKLPWTKMTQIWATPKDARCAESTNKVKVGKDPHGRKWYLGGKYKNNYTVLSREVDGETEEYYNKTIQWNGVSEEVEFIVGLAVSGELFTDSKNLLENDREWKVNLKKFITDLREDMTHKRHRIPNVANKSD